MDDLNDGVFMRFGACLHYKLYRLIYFDKTSPTSCNKNSELSLNTSHADLVPAYGPSSFGRIQAEEGAWKRWPRLCRTNQEYRPPATYTAATLINIGHWNWSGRANMIVVTYANSSKRFCAEASMVENAPR